MTRFDDLMFSRRALLRAGLSGAALATLPWSGGRIAWADTANPHLVITFHGDGGWDPTQVLDPHDPLDATDGIDVDIPEAVSGIPPSQIVTIGDLSYVSNPVSRPNVDAFFSAWASRTAIVNGINTRSTSHDQSTQLVHTGYLDPSRAGFAVMAARHLGEDLPLPHLQLSGPSFGGQFAGLSGRVGGQLGQALAYTRMRSNQLAVSALGEGHIQQALVRLAGLDAAADDAIAGRREQFRESQTRADKLTRLARSIPSGSNNGMQLATALGNAFRQGLTTSVTINGVGGFDTHGDHLAQGQRWDQLFAFLTQLMDGLNAEPGVQAASLLDETTIIYVSEFGRTPQLNGDNGKDHHPWTSVLMIGKRVRPGTYGLTDRDQEGVKTNFDTGRPDDTGSTIDVTNMVGGILTLCGANASAYLPAGVRPFTAMVNA